MKQDRRGFGILLHDLAHIFDKRRRRSDRACGRLHRTIHQRFALLLLLGGLLLPLARPPLHAAEQTTALPLILAIEPDHVYNDQDTSIAIRGAGFAEGALVTVQACNVSRRLLEHVTVQSSMILTATVPAGWPEATYNLTVINPDGQQSEPAAFGLTVIRRGDASFGPWTLTSSMMSGRSGFAAVATDTYVYAIGSGSIERAAILPDGSLGTWHFTAALSSSRTNQAAVVVGNAIYILGGEESFERSRNVERATINPNGSLGPWQVLPDMIRPRAGFAAVAVGRYLYALGGYGNDSLMTSVERTVIQVDDTVGPWELTSSLSVPRSTAATFGQFIYALSGYALNSNPEVERTEVLPDGRLAPWQIVSILPQDRPAAAAVVAGGYLYVLGGSCAGTLGVNIVEWAAINGDGQLGPWQPTASMLQGRHYHAAVAAGSHIYALGGWSVSRSVEYAPARTRLDQSIFLPVITR